MLPFPRQNIWPLLFAVVLAVALWAVVENPQNSEVVELFPSSPLVNAVNVPRDLVVVGESQTVQVYVAVPLDLQGHLSPDALAAQVDLSGAQAGVGDYSVQVTAKDRRLRVERVAPERISVRTEPLAQKVVPVEANVVQDVSFGWVAGEPDVTPKEITVSGPKSRVASVSTAAVDLRLGAARANLQRFVEPTLYGGDGTVIDRQGLALSPSQVLVEVPIRQDVTYKVVPVLASVRGLPRLGYRIEGIFVFPATVTIVGEPQRLGEVNYVSTAVLDVTNATSDVVQEMPLNLPSGIVSLRGGTFTVQVTISPIQGSLTLPVATALRGLSPGLVASVSPTVVSLTVQGPLPAVMDMQQSDSLVQLDLSGLGQGTYVLEPKATLPPGVTLQQLNPQQVTVEIRRAPEAGGG
ncbi:MAG: hypothetical protein HYX89_07615 [Chloroflexi bacterium]|nr:hypothetical protein [Chloroflexota bacterium]